MPPPEPLLVAEDVTAGYGGEPALRGLSLAVRAGEVVGLVGPNGSGKTTLIRVASRALRPSAGRVLLAGRDPHRVPGREAARIVAVVPQDLLPAFSYTVLEMVLLGRTPYLSRWRGGGPDDLARARDAMAAVGVQHLADRPVQELSGGERRRVVLAQALAQDAPVLLLDEPTTHLDVRHVLEVLAIVRRLADAEGKAVLAVLHDLTLAGAVCDRLCVLDRGRLVAAGRPEEVVTRELLRGVYGVEAEIEPSRLSGRPTVALHLARPAPSPAGRRAHVIGGAGTGSPLMRLLAEHGYEVSTGVLHATDTDDLVAERLNLLRVSVPPFSGIDAETADACRGLLKEADLLVVCDAPYGPGNLENLRLALEAARGGTPTLLVERVPIEERDFTGGRATELWAELRRLGRTVRDYGELPLEVG